MPWGVRGRRSPQPASQPGPLLPRLPLHTPQAPASWLARASGGRAAHLRAVGRLPLLPLNVWRKERAQARLQSCRFALVYFIQSLPDAHHHTSMGPGLRRLRCRLLRRRRRLLRLHAGRRRAPGGLAVTAVRYACHGREAGAASGQQRGSVPCVPCFASEVRRRRRRRQASRGWRSARRAPHLLPCRLASTKRGRLGAARLSDAGSESQERLLAAGARVLNARVWELECVHAEKRVRCVAERLPHIRPATCLGDGSQGVPLRRRPPLVWQRARAGQRACPWDSAVCRHQLGQGQLLIR